MSCSLERRITLLKSRIKLSILFVLSIFIYTMSFAVNSGLYPAVFSGDIEKTKILLAQQTDFNAKPDSQTILMLAIKMGHLEIVRLLVEAKVDLEIQSNNIYSALHVAVQYDHLEIVQFLVSAGANLEDFTRDNGYTPLHVAVRYDHLEVVKFLLEAGANVEALTKNYDYTPLSLAIEKGEGNLGLILCLLSAGAKLEAANIYAIFNIAKNNIIFRLEELPSRRIDFTMAGVNMLAPIEILLWYIFKNCHDLRSNSQSHLFDLNSLKNLIKAIFAPEFFLTEQKDLLSHVHDFIHWIFDELAYCKSQKEFFEKLFDYFFVSNFKEKNFLIKSINSLVLKEYHH